MMKFRLRYALLSVSISFATAAIAKILPHKPVPSVEFKGVRYSEADTEYVVATDIATGKPLWKVRVFHTHIKPWLEPDVQFVFIKELRLANGSVYVRDAKARCYAVNVNDHRVHKAACKGVFPEHQGLQP
jgi:outer membrane protein assembly factor BamB